MFPNKSLYVTIKIDRPGGRQRVLLLPLQKIAYSMYAGAVLLLWAMTAGGYVAYNATNRELRILSLERALSKSQKSSQGSAVTSVQAVDRAMAPALLADVAIEAPNLKAKGSNLYLSMSLRNTGAAPEVEGHFAAILTLKDTASGRRYFAVSDPRLSPADVTAATVQNVGVDFSARTATRRELVFAPPAGLTFDVADAEIVFVDPAGAERRVKVAGLTVRTDGAP